MQNSNIYLTVFLLAYYGICESHWLDPHIHSPSEIYEEESNRKEIEKREAEEIFYDQEADPKDRFDAFEKLVASGNMI